jgi:hypothetical protein
MLTRKHFIEFADFLVEEELKIIPRYNKIKKLYLDEFLKGDLNSVNHKILGKINSVLLEELNKQHRELTANIMLILDRNSIRFNKYQFKNYIISHVEKKQLNNTENENTTKLNKVG